MQTDQEIETVQVTMDLALLDNNIFSVAALALGYSNEDLRNELKEKGEELDLLAPFQKLDRSTLAGVLYTLIDRLLYIKGDDCSMQYMTAVLHSMSLGNVEKEYSEEVRTND